MREMYIRPFPGFYESRLSDILDFEYENAAEYDAGDRQDEENIPNELKLSESDFADIYARAANLRPVYRMIAADYVEALNSLINDEYGLNMRMTFSDLDSPAYYNFETDRLFVNIRNRDAKRLLHISKSDNHETLKTLIDDYHSSRSGFHSYYSDDLESWLEKPFETWDHNELGTLFCAAISVMEKRPGKYGSRTPFERLLDDDVFDALNARSHDYFCESVDWTRYESEVKEARQSLLDELPDNHLLKTNPRYRCPDTLDMFSQSVETCERLSA
jgi:hypothetical protein